MGKLFVLTRADLPPGYQAVQAGHAVAEWMLRNDGHEWRNQTLVYLSVPDEPSLAMWADKIRRSGFT